MKRLSDARRARAQLAALALATIALAALAGCPPANKTEKKPAEDTKACVRLGQQCEFSPGKLGSCVALDGCATPAACIVCQSQH
jgi:hypothetical protein